MTHIKTFRALLIVGTSFLAFLFLCSTNHAHAGTIIGALVGNDLTDPTNSGTLTGSVTFSKQKNDAEAAVKAFDSSVGSKWYTQGGSFPQFIAFHFDNPVQKFAVNRYTISTANDVVNRDPNDWQFQGSNDGASWVDVDVQTGQAANWTARRQTQDYQFANNTAYEHYRFLITNTRGGGADLQLSEIELFGTAGPVIPEPSTLTLAALGLLALLGFTRRRRK